MTRDLINKLKMNLVVVFSSGNSLSPLVCQDQCIHGKEYSWEGQIFCLPICY